MQILRDWTYQYRAFVLLIVGAVFTFALAKIAFSAPPLTQYAPGETLQPTCDPGDANCSVEATALTIGSAVGSGTASSLLMTQTTSCCCPTVVSPILRILLSATPTWGSIDKVRR